MSFLKILSRCECWQPGIWFHFLRISTKNILTIIQNMGHFLQRSRLYIVITIFKMARLGDFWNSSETKRLKCRYWLFSVFSFLIEAFNSIIFRIFSKQIDCSIFDKVRIFYMHFIKYSLYWLHRRRFFSV